MAKKSAWFSIEINIKITVSGSKNTQTTHENNRKTAMLPELSPSSFRFTKSLPAPIRAIFAWYLCNRLAFTANFSHSNAFPSKSE